MGLQKGQPDRKQLRDFSNAVFCINSDGLQRSMLRNVCGRLPLPLALLGREVNIFIGCQIHFFTMLRIALLPTLPLLLATANARAEFEVPSIN